MSTKLYVGNLPDSVKEKDLRELFSSFGEVDEIAVFKGYGFVVSTNCLVVHLKKIPSCNFLKGQVKYMYRIKVASKSYSYSYM